MWLKIKQSECNLNCVFCPPESRYKSELTFNFLIELIESARGAGLKRIWWTGGEPLLFDNFDEVVLHASKLGFEQKVSTNGLLLHKCEEILDVFSRINISLHSLESRKYADITNGGDLLVLQKNISKAAGKTLIKLNVVLGKYNVDEVNNIIAYANEASVIPRFILLRERSCKKSTWIDKNRIEEKLFWNKLPDVLEPADVEGNNIKASYYETKDYIFGVVRLTDKCEEEHCNVIFIDSKKHLYNCRGLSRKDIIVKSNLMKESLKQVIESKEINHGNTCRPKSKD